MATKKVTTKTTSSQKTTFYKIGGKIGKLAVGLIAGKDHLVEMADGAVESVKSTIQNITAGKKAASTKITAKKAVVKQADPAAKKSVKPAVKKSSPSRKISSAVPSKKAAPAKKVIKKAAKKVAGKK